ncbi:cytochrome c3 family protein [Ignavibacteriales bacterium]
MAMKTKYIYLSLTILAVAFLLFSAFTSRSHLTSDSATKVIKFSHQLHSSVMECADCHTGVTTAASLNQRMLPEKSVCASCHDVESSDKCGTCHYEDVYEPLQQKTSGLIFNHAFHLKNAPLSGNGDKCLGCHKDVNLSTGVELRGKYNPTMEACWTCPQRPNLQPMLVGVCHVSTANLIPANP